MLVVDNELVHDEQALSDVLVVDGLVHGEQALAGVMVLGDVLVI